MAGEFLEFIIGVMRRNSPAIHTRLELRIQNLCSASQNSVYCQSYDGPKSKLICEILLCKLPSANDRDLSSLSSCNANINHNLYINVDDTCISMFSYAHRIKVLW